ncbi:MBL fold metallo-hydrolase [Odoribacter lunatus]|uniref:MBL fold metallo-hydrolase n=1 Tax=Odoribacter lunatus TaxID=2941335 RepID=UPI00203FFB84|nr:MBL fold metallo-hydrolase [Odoribacter lunatus]
MKVSSHINDLFTSICYRIGYALFDPGDEWDGFKEVDKVLLTHAHFDHIYGLNKLMELKPDIKIYTNEYGRKMLLNAKMNLSLYYEMPFVLSNPVSIVVVENDDDVRLDDNLLAKAIYTPGHNPSCITWVVGEILFTGDSYIPGIKTVTNLPGGNKKQAEESLKLIDELATNRQVYPGHKI